MPLPRPTARALLCLILLAGAFFRFQGLDWDEGHHLHPDERFISMVEEHLLFPKSVSEYLDSAHSPLNPYNRGHDSFVYGTFPVFLTKALAAAAHKDGYDGSYLFGRALSALFDLATVWLVYRLARRFGGRRTALAAASLLAFCPLGIQLSHFWAVDTFLATFATLTLYGCVRLARGRSGPAGDAATGLALGLAVACKVTGLALFAAVGIALLLRLAALREQSPGSALRSLARVTGRGALILLVAAAAIRMALPYAFLGWKIDPRYLRDMKSLAAISSSVAGFPPALQWAGRTVMFPVKNFVCWGAGPFFGLAAIAALLWALAALRRRADRDLAPLVAYAVFVALYHGLTLVKSIRYFYPAYPTLAVLSALLLARLAPTGAAGLGRRAVAAAVLGGNFLAAVAFTSVYRHPHPRLEASRWIFAHVPPPARFANEAWDDGQPIPLPGSNADAYAGPVLELYDPDSTQKVEKVLKALAGADWIAVTSNRVWGNVTRVPLVFPMTVAYYRALFSGALGFEHAADFTSYPRLGPLRFDDDLAEEQFTVYDHPRVLLFRKTRDYSQLRARRILLAAMPTPPPTIYDWEKWPRSRRKTSPPVVPPHLARGPSGAPALAEAETGSVAAAAIWYGSLLVLAAAALPLAWLFFSRLSDRGFGLARVLGLVLATYAMNLSVQRLGLPNGRRAATLALLLLAAAGGAVFLRRRRAILAFVRENRRALLQSEIVFAAGFLLFLGLRALNPEITWGEKPMDFSILNILVRTRTLPASDPWFAGAPLGYYTFGQEMVAFLTLVTGLSTRYTFNLAFGLLGGTILQAAFSLARNWSGTLSGGFAGAAFVTLAGNLAGLREWWFVRRPHHQALEWNYFWATSRVIKDTINEYPLWSLLFADLHAHVLAIPLLLLVAAAALQFVRAHADPAAFARTRLLSAALLGGLAGAEALTNAWDAPLLAGLLVLTAVVAAFPGASVSSGRAIARALAGLALAAGAAVAVAFPLWARGGGPPGWGRNVEKGASGLDVATVFGLFFFLAAAWWLCAAADRLGWKGARRTLVASAGVLLLAALALRSADAFCVAGILLFAVAALALSEKPEDRLAQGFVASALFLVLFAQRLYIYDRMNTFFKLYLESWLLLAVATAALVFRPGGRPGSFARWPAALKGGFAALATMALFTTVTVARGALTNTSPTRKGPRAGPTLDGLKYLETSEPGEYRAVAWMRRTISGTPVVLEAQGPSYQDFGRVSMLTGLPTVLGWEYHVQQRGNRVDAIAARRSAVEAMYSNPSADAVETLLRRYHVGYVYVGPLERKTYPKAGLAKFETARELFRVVYENPQARIYRVVGGDSEDVLAPSREELPAPAAGTPAPEVVEPEEPPIVSQAPSPGRAPFSGMKEPRDAAVDGRGRLWVADFGHSRLRIFDGNGGYLGGWGGRGDGTYQLREPCGVAIRGDDLYIADTWNGRVEAFTLTGGFRAAAKELYGPRGIAAAEDGSVWATDTGNHRLAVYDRDLGHARTIGRKGTGPLEFDAPVGIAAAPSGSIYVCDTGNRRIQVLDRDGNFLRALPFPGWNGSVEPHIEADEGDVLYVTDPLANALLTLDASGRVLERRETDPAGRKYSVPTGVALDRKDRILYVVNSGDSSISSMKLPERKGK
ncbi:MAG: DUF2298 domain-containing protein [Acidobacteriota bacterium]